MITALITNMPKQRWAYQAGSHRAGIDDEIAHTCVLAGREQLCRLNGTSEDYDEDREQAIKTGVF